MHIRILMFEEDKSTREALERVIASLGFEFASADGLKQALAALSGESFDLCVVSLSQPAEAVRSILAAAHARKNPIPVVVRTAQAAVGEIVSAFRMGAVDFIPRPFHDELCAEVIQRALAERGRVSAALRTSGVALVGDHPAMHVVLERVDQVADSSASVLIRGEEGTGKEVVARLIHACGARRGGPFVTVRLAGSEPLLTMGELFGTPHPGGESLAGGGRGKLQEAEHGTLFIDEIANLSRELQIGLLRLARDPASRTQANVRIVAATAHNLEEAVREGAFIEDLYYRLNIIPIEIPPLRERLEDIPVLVEYFRRAANAFHGRNIPPFPPDMLVRLGECPWPGNVRQLEDVVDRLVASAKDRGVTVYDLPASMRTGVKSLGPAIVDLPPHGVDLRMLLTQLEDRLIGQALERTGGNKNRAAELLGMNRTTLVEKLRRRIVT
jgi:Response regulator containing CheY-like receiver, AAA-type ATPase, and DNA-binding domains